MQSGRQYEKEEALFNEIKGGNKGKVVGLLKGFEGNAIYLLRGKKLGELTVTVERLGVDR